MAKLSKKSSEAIAGIERRAAELFSELAGLDLPAQVEAVNRIRMALHQVSPFRSEPVDCVVWVPASDVTANDYNPNKVAPPEMELLEHSIREDGYTQPIVGFKREDGATEVVDGFHRHKVGKKKGDIRDRIHGYLPVAVINAERADKKDRVASTIRHNRARGVHGVKPMSEIVADLVKLGWSDEKIAIELGMEPDEVLRLKQRTGLGEIFADRDFSKSWS